MVKLFLSGLHFRSLQYFCGHIFALECVCVCQLVIFDEGSRMHVIIRVYIHGKCSTMRKKVFLSLFFSHSRKKGCREAFIMPNGINGEGGGAEEGSWVLANDGIEKNWMNYLVEVFGNVFSLLKWNFKRVFSVFSHFLLKISSQKFVEK